MSKIIFFNHIPKTGGSALNDIIQKYIKKYDFINYIHPWHKLLPLYKQYQHPENYIFTVVRNPLHRYVSMINYINTWKNLEKQLYLHFDDKLTIKHKNYFNLDLIIHFPVHTYSHGDDGYHFKPQIHNVNFFNHNKIYKYENGLHNVIEDINLKFNINIPIQIKKINVSNKIFTVEQLSKIQIDTLHQIYKEDFNLWNSL